MLVCVTVDRVILVYLPLKAKSICTKGNTTVNICIVTLLIIGVNCHWIFSVVKGGENQFSCPYQDGFKEFHVKYWPWIDASVASLGPFTILIVCNILIAVQLFKAGQLRKRRMNVSNSKQDNTKKSVTIMLVTISVVFLCLTSPIVFEVMRKLARRNNEEEVPTLAERARETLFWVIVNMLMYLNSAVNFVMYCLSGTKFRESMRELFLGKKTIFRNTNSLRGSISQSGIRRRSTATFQYPEVDQASGFQSKLYL
ncbi:unnamed protein product [Owenia fusiformis]|uniref:Uncharacterized protein n=1 Tax=Owenia fusiformis TaxID=6347 RepID=A0A8J1U2U5_OWEFU|nr:unnamed protein product [Owenia fusiformis]